MLFVLALMTLQASFISSLAVKNPTACSPDAFSYPDVFGADVFSITANEVHNYTTFSLRPGSSDVSRPIISFCNVSVSYIHPGWNDTTRVSVWLPLQDWNGRLQALGGGGYSATFGALYLTQAVAAGYVAIDTDAGHSAGTAASLSPSNWALTSPGNVNLYLLEDFAARSLSDMTIIGKSVTQNFFGSPPKYSYFSGCSGGGRQAFMLAQRYPDSYDGILAAAPAINIENFIPAGYWAMQLMKDIAYYPPPCEIDAFTREAIVACDALDGLEDGIIGEPNLCNFSANSVVGKFFSCNGTTHQFTRGGATVVEAVWRGPRSPYSDKSGWFGLNKDASLTSTYVKTQCPHNSTTNCTAAASDLTSSWLRYFLAKDPAWNASAMTTEQFFEYLHSSEIQYGSMLGASSPDLTGFKAAGGKMIAWHGGADEAIPPNGTIAYYQQVLAVDPTAQDYFRFFEAPGVGHCTGGSGFIPNAAFDALTRWVEEDVVPERLLAVSQDSSTASRELCPYPLKQRYVGGSKVDAAFECVDVRTEEDQPLEAQFPFFSPK